MFCLPSRFPRKVKKVFSAGWEDSFSADRPVYGSPSGRFCLGAAVKPPLSEDAEHRVEGG
jgi:hypothetical protein